MKNHRNIYLNNKFTKEVLVKHPWIHFIKVKEVSHNSQNMFIIYVIDLSTKMKCKVGGSYFQKNKKYRPLKIEKKFSAFLFQKVQIFHICGFLESAQSIPLIKENTGWYGKASFAGKSFDSVHLVPLCCCKKSFPVIKDTYVACLKLRCFLSLLNMLWLFVWF